MDKQYYIHYGSNKFDINKFRKIKNDMNIRLPKPFGGLWASRVDSKNGWFYWCKENEFNEDRLNEYFTFTLKDDARVLTITDEFQLTDLPKIDEGFSEEYLEYRQYIGLDSRIFPWIRLDFEKLSEEYDAIEVLLSEGKYSLRIELSGWDCDSIIIMNPKIIELEE